MKAVVSTRKSAFTLVEIAIVLVVIGLIVGGVLGGLSLIHAARIKSGINQFDKYTVATTAFKLKYLALPGDIHATTAASFGFATGTGRDGSLGHGDADGRISNCALGVAQNLGCETALFWKDLTQSGLINDQLTAYNPTATTVVTTALTNQQLAGAYLPKSKLRDQLLFHIVSYNGTAYFLLGAFSNVAFLGLTDISPGAVYGLSPMEAFNIDTKIDDGLPATGKNINLFTATWLMSSVPVPPFQAPLPAATGVCVVNTTPPSYNTRSPFADDLTCATAIRTSF